MNSWSELYKPNKFTDLVYTDDIHLECINTFKKLTNTSLVIINGPVGVGKSTLVRVLAKACNYEILEYTDSINKRNSSLTSKSTILLIEDVENTFNVNKVLKLGYPVIITSENFDYKNSVTYKIKKHNIEDVQKIVDRIYKNVGSVYKKYTKIISWCDFDIRYILNNLQIQNLNFVRKDHASFYEIFSKYLKWNNFDKNIVKFVFNSYISAKFTNKIFETAESFSLYDNLLESYYVLPLDRVNRIRGGNIKNIKSAEYQSNRKIPNKDAQAYFMNINFKTTSEDNIYHIQEILSKEIVCLDENIHNYDELLRIKKFKKEVILKEIEKCTGTFKFKYKKGVSKYSKRYLTLEEFFNL